MNFLAHIYLSGNDPELMIGNFIADSVKGKKFAKFPDRVTKGILLHRKIDSYTDSHSIVKQSVSRLSPIYGRYSAVIIDIFYDHYLAANWNQYEELDLPTYVDNFYALLHTYYDILPKRVQDFLPYMVKDNWLVSYATIPGIGKILYQMNQRTKNRSKMNFAIIELEKYYGDFEREFHLFFEELKIFVQNEMRHL